MYVFIIRCFDSFHRCPEWFSRDPRDRHSDPEQLGRCRPDLPGAQKGAPPDALSSYSHPLISWVRPHRGRGGGRRIPPAVHRQAGGGGDGGRGPDDGVPPRLFLPHGQGPALHAPRGSNHSLTILLCWSTLKNHRSSVLHDDFLAPTIGCMLCSVQPQAGIRSWTPRGFEITVRKLVRLSSSHGSHY